MPGQPGTSAYAADSAEEGDVTVEIEDSSVATMGANASAEYLEQTRGDTGGGRGGADADLRNVEISTSGANAPTRRLSIARALAMPPLS